MLPLVIFIYILIYIAKLCIAHTCVYIDKGINMVVLRMILCIDSKHSEEQGTACVTINPGEDASTIEISIEYDL